MLEVGTKVETPFGNGVIEWFTDYSVGRYYDVRLDDGQLVKVFNTEVDIL